ncbi:MAG: stage II sporulation protein R [Lachnospiraceae bacterium]|nr:stage II sporulation protein R [Lachnospiraceae bacterium]
MGLRILRGAFIGVFLGVAGGLIITYSLHYIRNIGTSGVDYNVSEVSFVENADSDTMDNVIEAFNEYETPYCDSLEDTILRFHVRANSNSEDDISLKYKVRDDILMAIGGILEGDKTKEEVMSYLRDNLDFIKSIALNSIRMSGYDYDVKVYISKDYFPIRQYGEMVLPAGYYEALRIDIGEAEGENFWCILYPMMCYPLDAGAVVSNEDKEELKTVLSEEDYKKLFVEHDEEKKVKVKLKFMEWLGF